MGPGGGGGVLPYVCILGMCRARDPHFQPWISVPEHIIFTNYPQKNPFRSITILLFFLRILPFRRPSFSKFLLFQPVHRLPRPAQPERQRRSVLAVPEIRWRFAQNGSSSFRSPAFSRSKRFKLVPEPRVFTLDRELVPEPWPIFHFAAAHTYHNLGWVPPPPPEMGPVNMTNLNSIISSLLLRRKTRLCLDLYTNICRLIFYYHKQMMR